MRNISAILATLALAVGGTLLAAPIASAAPAANYGCAGSKIDTYTVADSRFGGTWGYVNLYYSSSNSGTNCAVYVATKYVGTVHGMEIEIKRSNQSSWISDNGRYTKYAGPVTVGGTNGTCIDLEVKSEAPDASVGFGSEFLGVHCG
ncbi:hypothetical protein ACIGXA_12030 [Streptomyces fildesensis]|uniref:Spore-associated protein A n=1 Tax=Streptomyces fildesensis TaxID=375757 RepID=A0ABW8C489_9ACTN